jgi:hypothetical protein
MVSGWPGTRPPEPPEMARGRASGPQVGQFFSCQSLQVLGIAAVVVWASVCEGLTRMDNPEQLGSAHECFSEFLHAIDPRVLIRIACAAAGIAVSGLVKVRYRNPRIHIPGFSKRARTFTVDLVYTVHTAQGKVVEVWIFEIQLSEDDLKISRWAFYPVTYAMICGGVGRLAVFCPEPALRAN